MFFNFWNSSKYFEWKKKKKKFNLKQIFVSKREDNLLILEIPVEISVFLF